MIKVYGVPSCNQIRNTKKIFENNSVDYEFINVKKHPIKESLLKRAVEQCGLETVVNSKGMTYRKLGLGKMELTAEEKFSWLLKEQGMIKRPLLEINGSFHVGYDEDAILRFIKENS